MKIARANQGAQVKDAIPLLEKLGARLPRRAAGPGDPGAGLPGPERAREGARRLRARARDRPESARVRAFLANDDLIKGNYDKARRHLPRGGEDAAEGRGAFRRPLRPRVQLPLRGPGRPRARALKTYLAEYKDSGSAQGFPEVFIWNSIARINLENGRLDAAMQAYEKGYKSVPGSSLPEDQKQVWLGRLQHGRCPYAREDGQARGGVERGPEDQEDDRRRRRAGEAVHAGLALPGGLPEARGRRLQDGGRGAEAGEPRRPVPPAAARPRLREDGREGRGAKTYARWSTRARTASSAPSPTRRRSASSDPPRTRAALSQCEPPGSGSEPSPA